MELRSLKNNVLVKLMPQFGRIYKNVLHLPDSAVKEQINHIGIVDSFGDGGRNKKGIKQPLDLKLGDLVMFGKHTGVRLMIDGVEYRYLKFKDILCVLEEE